MLQYQDVFSFQKADCERSSLAHNNSLLHRITEIIISIQSTLNETKKKLNSSETRYNMSREERPDKARTLK
jgi:hypothetical protein